MSISNVLLLVVDSLRYDSTADQVDAEDSSFRQLIDEGINFTHCFSQGISTAPSMTSMLTGRYPLDYGGHWYLDDEQRTFAETFDENGFNTGAIHSNPYVSARRNFDRGFDHFAEDIVSFEPDETLEGAPEKFLRIASRLSRIISRTPYTPAASINESVLSFIRTADSPWFLWTQYMDVHGPYLGGDNFGYRNKFRAEWLWRKAAVRNPDGITEAQHEQLRENYRKEVEYIDEQLGALLDGLDAAGELADTFVIVTSDHGDEFYEHGRYGHGNLPYDELIHVPLVIRPPEWSSLPRGAVVDDMVRSMDILPTILDAVDAEIPPAHQRRLAGESFLPLLEGESLKNSPIVISEKRVKGKDSLRIGFRTSEWKYIYDGTSDDRYLYELSEDPNEQKNVVATNPAIAEQFEDHLRDRLDRIETTSENIPVPDFDIDAGVRDRLKALGYRE